MLISTDENPNARVYKAEHIEMYVKLRFGIWGKAKLSSYETSYTATGGIKYAGSEDYLRAIMQRQEYWNEERSERREFVLYEVVSGKVVFI